MNELQYNRIINGNQNQQNTHSVLIQKNELVFWATDNFFAFVHSFTAHRLFNSHSIGIVQKRFKETSSPRRKITQLQ
jgi:hypothetical protein